MIQKIKKWMDVIDQPTGDMSSLVNKNTAVIAECYLDLVFLFITYNSTPVTQTKDMNVVKGIQENVERLTAAVEDAGNDPEQVVVFRRYLWIDRFMAMYRDMPSAPHDQPAYVHPDHKKTIWQWFVEPILNIRSDSLTAARPNASIMDISSYSQKMEFLTCFVGLIFEIEKFKTFGLDFTDYDDPSNQQNYENVCRNILSLYDRMIYVVNQYVYQAPHLKVYFGLGNIEVLVSELRARFENKND